MASETGIHGKQRSSRRTQNQNEHEIAGPIYQKELATSNADGIVTYRDALLTNPADKSSARCPSQGLWFTVA